MCLWIRRRSSGRNGYIVCGAGYAGSSLRAAVKRGLSDDIEECDNH